jgi:SagB-type dehydrogenase family enzyme
MNIQLFSKSIKLPKPQYDSNVSIEETLLKRRSIRSYKSEPLSIAEISQLLWSAQGVTNRKGFRTAPSAGALYPLEVYIAAGNVTDLYAGIYKDYPHRHEIVNTVKGDKRSELCRAGLGQSSIKNAPAVMLFCAVYERVTGSYGKRGIQYVHMEVGHAIQNVCLQAISLGLGSVIIGAFNDFDVKDVMNFELDEHPLLILPVGKLKNV